MVTGTHPHTVGVARLLAGCEDMLFSGWAPCRLSGIGKHAFFPGLMSLRNRIDTFARLVQPLDPETLVFHPRACWSPEASGEARTCRRASLCREFQEGWESAGSPPVFQ